jgi:comEA protein
MNSWKKKSKITFTEFIKRKKLSLINFWSQLRFRGKKVEAKKKNELPDLPEEKLDVGAFVEKHRFVIGGILIVLILISGGLLLYRENYFKPAMEKKIAEQDARISDLEAEIDDINSSKNAVEASAQTAAPAVTQSSQAGQVAGAATTSSTKPIGKVNINAATATELDSLPGIGTAYAGRIIDYRTSHGGFKSIEELKNVKGIGDKTFEKLADLVTI